MTQAQWEQNVNAFFAAWQSEREAQFKREQARKRFDAFRCNAAYVRSKSECILRASAWGNAD